MRPSVNSVTVITSVMLLRLICNLDLLCAVASSLPLTTSSDMFLSKEAFWRLVFFVELGLRAHALEFFGPQARRFLHLHVLRR